MAARMLDARSPMVAQRPLEDLLANRSADETASVTTFCRRDLLNWIFKLNSFLALGLISGAHAHTKTLRYVSRAQKNYCTTLKTCQTLFSLGLNLFFRVYFVLSRCVTEGLGIGLRIFLNNSSNLFIFCPSFSLLSSSISQTLWNPTQETLNTSGTSYPTPESVSSLHVTTSVMGDYRTNLAVGAIIPFA